VRGPIVLRSLYRILQHELAAPLPEVHRLSTLALFLNLDKQSVWSLCAFMGVWVDAHGNVMVVCSSAASIAVNGGGNVYNAPTLLGENDVSYNMACS
jgi:hypothetical protein